MTDAKPEQLERFTKDEQPDTRSATLAAALTAASLAPAAAKLAAPPAPAPAAPSRAPSPNFVAAIAGIVLGLMAITAYLYLQHAL